MPTIPRSPDLLETVLLDFEIEQFVATGTHTLTGIR